MSGTGNRVAGKAKELGGKVTGDRRTQARGKSQQVAGKAENKTIDARKKVEGAAEKLTGRRTANR